MALILRYFLPNLVVSGAYCGKVVEKAITMDNLRLLNLDEILQDGRYPRRNQVGKFWWRSVKGFMSGGGSNFCFSHWLWSSSLQHSRTAVRVCDIARYWSKFPSLNLPHMYLQPRWRWHCWNFAKIFGIRKTTIPVLAGRTWDHKTMPYNIPGILVFWCLRSWRNSNGVIPNGSAEYRGVGSNWGFLTNNQWLT